MSILAIYGRRMAVAAVGVGFLGAGLATAADAAPELPTAPSASDVPVPVLTRPIDASNGLLGIDRGSLPGVATPDLPALPGIAQFPGLEIVPLPKADPPAAPASDPSASDTSATSDTSAPATSGSAMAGLDDAGFLAGLV